MSWEDSLANQIVACRVCPRLAAYREEVARHPPRRYAGASYHARGVPGFGDVRARLWIIGLAPAAHGANRTGRMFTGDRSGEWLYQALYEVGLSSAPTSHGPHDGLKLYGVFISAVIRCAPPANKPRSEEIRACSIYLEREWQELQPSLRVVLALGTIAHQKAADLLGLRPKPAFHHGSLQLSATGIYLLSSYHPSQQNTFTGRLTWPMWRSIFQTARKLMEGGASDRDGWPV